MIYPSPWKCLKVSLHALRHFLFQDGFNALRVQRLLEPGFVGRSAWAWPGLGNLHGHWGNLGRLGIIRYGNMRDDVGFTILNNGFHICFHVCHVLQYHVVHSCTMLYRISEDLNNLDIFEHARPPGHIPRHPPAGPCDGRIRCSLKL